uniref:Uncharacterized protein n=1 Tax=Avena sativa TaxID=4498 RepID=A0ACD5TH22_AVESA
MPDKTQWPKSDHVFFMHPPILKATAGRPKTERYKGCIDKKSKKGKHLCPICKEYGHYWQNCKKGNPDDLAAMMAIREPPKKRTKTTKTMESSIVPFENVAPTRMCFPPRSKTASSQLSIESSMPSEQTNVLVKVKPKKKKKETAEKIPMVPLHSPAMSTRSRKFIPPSPAMSTRSKRRLSL